MKKVFIIRNAQYSYNASMQRVVSALEGCYRVSIIERIRSKKEKLELEKSSKLVSINIPSKIGGGISNLRNLTKYNFKLFITLFKNKKDIDIIHAFDFDTAFISLIFSKMFKKKVVYHIADFYVDSRNFPEKLKKVIKKLDFWVINNANVTIICTEERKEQIKGSFPKHLEVVHNIPLFELQEELDIRKKEMLNFCYIGTLSETRFIKELIEFFINNPKYKFTIGGFGPLSEYVERESQNYENIKYLGKVPYEETSKYYSKSDCILALYNPKVKNNQYSAPNKFYESYVLKKPIIVAKGSGIDEYVEKYNTGFISDYSYESFEECIKGMSNEDYFNVVKGFEKNEFSKENLIRKIQEIYKYL